MHCVLVHTVHSLSFLQEIEVGGSRKAIIIFVPVPQLKSFQKIQVRLVRELEKKFSGKHVVFIAQVRLILFKHLIFNVEQVLGVLSFVFIDVVHLVAAKTPLVFSAIFLIVIWGGILMTSLNPN